MGPLHEVSFDRVVRAVKQVRQRLLRATAALDAANILYAVVGGNAVAAWVSTVDPSAVRNTKNVDLLVNRADISRVTGALQLGGFSRLPQSESPLFVDEDSPRVRSAVRLVVAEERFRAADPMATPGIGESVICNGLHVVTLDGLVRMKLTGDRVIDRVHLRDMIDVGLIDETWVGRFPPELARRLQHIFDTPDG